MDKIEIYTDESVNVVIAEGLNRRGIKAVTSRDAGNLSLLDEEQLNYAIRNNLVIVTHDVDFIFLSKKYDHNGIIYVHQNKYSIGEMISEIKFLYDNVDQKRMENRLEFL